MTPHSDDVFPALAAGLCQDGGIGLVMGDHWRFNPAKRVIEVNKVQVEEKPVQALGLLGHEIGHVWISR